MALAERRLESEWLDVLPAGDPRALRSRRDLRLVNVLMGHHGILWRNLRDMMGPDVPRRIVELGAGDGTLLLSAARKLAGAWPDTVVELVDRQDLVRPDTRAAFGQLGWRVECVSADLLSWAKQNQGGRADIMFANLVLHHFEPAALRELFSMIAGSTHRFIAIEPRRSWPALGGGRALGLLGCNDVTRHDAVVSVRAGFTGAELSRLWPEGDGWVLMERPAGLFSHLFLARRPATGIHEGQR